MRSSLAISTIGLLVGVVRVALDRLEYLLPSLDVFYDISLAALWTISVVAQLSDFFSESDTKFCHFWNTSDYCILSVGDGWCTLRNVSLASLAVSLLALGWNFGRAVNWAIWVIRRGRINQKDQDQEKGLPLDRKKRFRDSRGLLLDEEERFVRRAGEALSPVLAFYPEDVLDSPY